ncbi:MAG: lysophospholipid acyltransferase family protein [Burkholderiaceae bacterium]
MWLRGLWLRAWRLPLLVVLLVYGLASALLAFPLIGESARRAQIAGWSRWLLRACGVQPIELSPPAEGRLADRGEGQMLLLNHLSWLDIFVIDALAPATFVAKSEIARWPLLGTLVAAVGTEFIERGRRHAVHRVIERLDAKLGAGTRVAVFPEGTTTDGRRLLPFHGNLAQAAINAGAPVVPVGLRYLDPAGQPSDVPFTSAMITSSGPCGASSGIRD